MTETHVMRPLPNSDLVAKVAFPPKVPEGFWIIGKTSEFVV